MKGKKEDIRGKNFNKLDESQKREMIAKGNRPHGKNPSDAKGRTGSDKAHE
jgi:hypothetical protein